MGHCQHQLNRPNFPNCCTHHNLLVVAQNKQLQALVFFVCDLLAAGLAHAFFISNRLVAVASLQDCWLYIGSCVQCDQSSAAVSVPIGEGDLSQLILFAISSFNFDESLLPILTTLLVPLNFSSMPSLPLILYNMPFGMNLMPWPKYQGDFIFSTDSICCITIRFFISPIPNEIITEEDVTFVDSP